MGFKAVYTIGNHSVSSFSFHGSATTTKSLSPSTHSSQINGISSFHKSRKYSAHRLAINMEIYTNKTRNILGLEENIGKKFMPSTALQLMKLLEFHHHFFQFLELLFACQDYFSASKKSIVSQVSSFSGCNLNYLSSQQQMLPYKFHQRNTTYWQRRTKGRQRESWSVFG